MEAHRSGLDLQMKAVVVGEVLSGAVINLAFRCGGGGGGYPQSEATKMTETEEKRK